MNPTNLTNLQEAKEEKAKLVWMLNAIKEKIDAYWLDDIAIDSWPFRKLCSDKQSIEYRIKEINKVLNSNK